MSVILSVNDVSKTFYIKKKHNTKEEITALNKLTFSVNEGEIFGLLGPNGAGKTTAMRIIATLIKSNSGDVFVAGKNIRDYPLDIRRKIGFLSGDLNLDGFFTPAYLFDFFSGLREIPKELAVKQKELLFERFGIIEYAHKPVSTLSNGMKQKISLVLSIAHDPDIIIFDEPTNGLDIVAAKMVTEFLLEMKNHGKTIILSTHLFNLVEKICDRVGIIIAGQMVLCDSLSRINEENSLEDMFFSFYNNFTENKEAVISR
jgi:sodium transport system ATP-binding protein